jgi:hypothetical protein
LPRKTSSSAAKKAAREVLLLCTAANIPPENKKILSRILTNGVDWEYLLKLVEFHGIAPLLAYNLTTSGLRDLIPEPYLDQLNRVYNSTLYRNMLLSRELTSILSAFSQHGVAVIPLKGTILAELLYKNPALRTSADIDILVHPEDTVKAGGLLAELGYKQTSERSHWDHYFHEAPYYKQTAFPIFLELHWDLEDRRLVNIPKAEIWQRAQPLQL